MVVAWHYNIMWGGIVMNKLQCEVCGSTDIKKEGSVFVCESCGCKYSIN